MKWKIDITRHKGKVLMRTYTRKRGNCKITRIGFVKYNDPNPFDRHVTLVFNSTKFKEISLDGTIDGKNQRDADKQADHLAELFQSMVNSLGQGVDYDISPDFIRT